jgi:hypothetical protein
MKKIFAEVNSLMNVYLRYRFIITNDKIELKITPKSNHEDEINWIVDNDVTNFSKTVSYDLTLIDGIVDLTFTTVSSSATAAVIRIVEGCNGTPVLGLDGDLLVKNAAGTTIVPTSVTDNGDGTYSFVFSTLAASTYNVNLDAVTVEVSGSSAIYGKTDTPATFTIV